MKKCPAFSLGLLSALLISSMLVSQMEAILPTWQGIWVEITTGSEPYPRAGHSAVWDSYNIQMIVFGGTSHDSQGRIIGLNDVWMFNPVSKIWSRGSNAPMTRYSHVAVWDTQNNQMIVYGGESYYASYQYYQDTWTYNPSTNTWAQRANGPSRRNWATGVWDPVHNQMIMFGGYYNPTDSALGDTWTYVPSTDTWVQKAAGPGARHAHMAVWNSRDNVMIVFGGVSLTHGQYGWWTDTWVYDPHLDQWSQKANMPSPLAQASAVWDPIHKMAIVFGGETAPSSIHAGETWIYDPCSDKWTVLTLGTQPSPRTFLQAVHVWDLLNNQMVLFGGHVYLGTLNDLWTFKVGVSPIPATVDIDPDTLNLKSNGEWITCYIELSEGYDVNDINVSTIMLNDTIPAELYPTEVGDYDGDGVPDLMVKFDRAEVISYILANVNMTKLIEERFMTVTLTITGNLNDGTPFQGSDTIRIILPMPRYGRFVDILYF